MAGQFSYQFSYRFIPGFIPHGPFSGPGPLGRWLGCRVLPERLLAAPVFIPVFRPAFIPQLSYPSFHTPCSIPVHRAPLNDTRPMDLHPLLLPANLANFAQIRQISRTFGQLRFFPQLLGLHPVHYTPVCSVPRGVCAARRASRGPEALAVPSSAGCNCKCC